MGKVSHVLQSHVFKLLCILNLLLLKGELDGFDLEYGDICA